MKTLTIKSKIQVLYEIAVSYVSPLSQTPFFEVIGMVKTEEIGVNSVINMVERAMEEYAAQQSTEWIPVSERLPDQKLKYVDVWMDKNGGYRFANYHLDHSIYPEIDIDRIKEDFAINKITFWRPLPEPPKP